ncbi:unnamed protein product [Larinioides sclopetarius]|uniref:Uncharacterized protein n=1 Tax=Larinioides sclopetarius TaxID=280406 RepID=A0AAV2BT41_9ARAC
MHAGVIRYWNWSFVILKGRAALKWPKSRCLPTTALRQSSKLYCVIGKS